MAGCDRLTIAPALLEELSLSAKPVLRQLHQPEYEQCLKKLDVSEAAFRFALNEDAMATEKLSEGIRLFVADSVKLEGILRAKVSIGSKEGGSGMY